MAYTAKENVHNRELKQIKTSLQDSIIRALKKQGLRQEAYAEKLPAAVDHIMDRHVRGHARKKDWSTRFAEIPANFDGLVSLFVENGSTAANAASAALSNSQLFMQPYQKTGRNLEKAKTELCCPSLGIEEPEVFPFLASHPRLFCYLPESLGEVFKINLLVLESPYVALSYNEAEKNFRRQRVTMIKQQFGSVSNALLRMAAAELSFLAPDTFGVSYRYKPYFVKAGALSIHRPLRVELEKKIVQTLGFKNRGNVMLPPRSLMALDAQQNRETGLSADLKTFVASSIKAFEEMPLAKGPRAWPFPILSVINGSDVKGPPMNAQEGCLTRANMVLGHFLKSYTLAVLSKA